MENKDKYFSYLDKLLIEGNFNINSACKNLSNKYKLVEEESLNILFNWIDLRNNKICFKNSKK